MPSLSTSFLCLGCRTLSGAVSGENYAPACTPTSTFGPDSAPVNVPVSVCEFAPAPSPPIPAPSPFLHTNGNQMSNFRCFGKYMLLFIEKHKAKYLLLYLVLVK